MMWSDDPMLSSAEWTDPWFASAEGVSSERREAWLSGLRRLSAQEIADRRSTCAPVVVACADEVNAASEDDQAMVLAVLGGIPPYDLRPEPLLQSIAEHTTRRETELRVRMFLAMGASMRSAPEMDERFDVLLDATRDDEDEFALRVRVNWATALLGRSDFVRAVGVLRDANRLAERIDSQRGRGYVWLHYARLHALLHDHEREDRRLARVRALLDEHDLPAVHHLYARTLLHRGLARGDWAEVERWSAELDRLGSGPLPSPLFEHIRRLDAADEAVARESSTEALEAVEALSSAGPETLHTHMHVADLRSRALTRSGDRAGAAAVVRAAIDLLAGATDDLPPSNVLARALQLRDSALACDDADSACAALEIAAEASLRRIVELDAQVRADGIVHADDRALLVDARQRFVRERRDLATSVADRLAVADDDLGRAARQLLATSEERWVVCAWCRSVLADSGDWLPAGHLLDDPHTASVTHGICESCATGVGSSAGGASA